MIWVVFGGLTLIVLAGLLWPLVAASPRTAARRDFDLAVFRAQLDEVDGEAVRGLIGAAEAEAARIEIKRRMLKAAGDAEGSGDPGGSKAIWLSIVAVAVLVPVATVFLYDRLGSPTLPDQPLAQRHEQERAEDAQVAVLIDKLRQRLAEKPDDVRGWLLLGRTLAAMERYPEAVQAFTKATEVAPAEALAWGGLGEALAFVAGGQVGPDSAGAFERALAIDPTLPAARYYLGLADLQNGRPEDALARWSALLADSPPDAPYAATLRDRIAAVSASLGKAPPEPPASVATSPAVNAMVDRLAARLKDNPGDFEGWMRLGQARAVQGDLAASRAAYQTAVDLRPTDPDALYRLGEAAARGGDKAGARTVWQKLLALLPAGSDDYKAVEKAIASLGA